MSDIPHCAFCGHVVTDAAAPCARCAQRLTATFDAALPARTAGLRRSLARARTAALARAGRIIRAIVPR